MKAPCLHISTEAIGHTFADGVYYWVCWDCRKHGTGDTAERALNPKPPLAPVPLTEAQRQGQGRLSEANALMKRMFLAGADAPAPEFIRIRKEGADR